MRLFLYGVFDRPPIREILRSRCHVDAINLVFCGFTNLVFHARAANPKHFGTSFFFRGAFRPPYLRLMNAAGEGQTRCVRVSPSA